MPISDTTRPDVRLGDIVDVPKGADRICTTRHRVEVTQIGPLAVSGPRVKADGTRMVSRSSVTADENGFLIGVVQWNVLAKSTVLRDGVAVAGAENLTPLRLTAPQQELLTDITTRPEMFLKRYSRWERTGYVLAGHGLAALSSEGPSHQRIVATKAGYDEAIRQGITVTRPYCSVCQMPDGSYRQTPCSSHGASSTAPNPGGDL